MKSKFFESHAALATFSGMFFWWAVFVLYISNRWEGISVYLIGLLPALALCLLIGWSADRWRFIESWRKRTTLGWGLVLVAHTVWLYATKAAARTRNIEFGTDGPLVIGGIATWVNVVALLILLSRGKSNNSKDNA
jgi:hypothetical protein